MRDVAVLPTFPERPDVQMTRVTIGQDVLKGAVGTVPNAHQGSEHVERDQVRL